jgi:hypothetical protein
MSRRSGLSLIVQVASKVSIIGPSCHFGKFGWELIQFRYGSGNGKSCLDGIFGQIDTVLQTAVDSEQSYWSSVTIM